MLGRDVLQGYGGVLVPPIAGYHELDVAMYAPLASSPLVQFTSWLTGNAPEVSGLSAINHHSPINLVFHAHCVLCAIAGCVGFAVL